MEVEDMAAELERLAALGVEPQDPPKRASDGNLQAWVTDPEGNRVELMELSPEGRQRTYRKA
jgi:lactoylglutathione lyase